MTDLFDELGRTRFDAAAWLPLLGVPALLLALWCWQFVRRQAARAALRRRRLPVRERVPVLGDLAAWLCLILALAATIVALARPVIVTSTLRTAGIDLVVLQDGSASMRVEDVRDDRWQRSMLFLRTLGESLRWEDDRMALALFASIATPQIRLTRDPNTLFFFLDHLQDESPYRVEDVGSWDTNIERGIYWGLRLIEKDAEVNGPSSNAKAFVLVSDGQAWSGEVERALQRAGDARIPVHVVGVGTTSGGVIPEPARAAGDNPVMAQLDRNSLSVIATAGGGRYFELDRETDREIASAIIAATRAQSRETRTEERAEDLYRRALLTAAALLVAAVIARAL